MYAAKNNIEELIKVLETESKSAVGWFKFQPMIMCCDKKRKKYDLNVNNSIIILFVDSATPLGIKINNQLHFEIHFSTMISFYIFLSRQYSLLHIYIYLYTVNVF